MGDSEWLEKQKRSIRKTRMIIILVAVLVLAGIIGGISYAYLKPSSGGGSSNSGFNNGNNGPGPNGGNSGSKYFTWDGKPVNLAITPNPTFKKSFYGLNYGPVNATFPWCGNTLGDVIEDVKILSQLTNRLRLYGMDCNMANYTITAIELLGLNMTVIPTVWIDNNMTTYQRQYNDLFNNLNQHGFKHIEGISVGNEVLFRQEIQATDLFSRINNVRNKVRAMPGCPPTLPVFTSDIGSTVNSSFVSAVDIVLANDHPYFAGVSVQQAANWTFQFFNNNDAYLAKQQNKPSIISEVGWPSAGASVNASVASLPNEQAFLQSFVCTANAQGTRYYYFETFDTPWKTAQFGILEGSWGLFNPDRSVKPGIIFPDCPPTAPSLY